jgi:hypothetical protein
MHAYLLLLLGLGLFTFLLYELDEGVDAVTEFLRRPRLDPPVEPELPRSPHLILRDA